MTGGELVRHRRYGVGRVLGWMTIEIDGQTWQCLTLVYACGGKLRVPSLGLHELEPAPKGSELDYLPSEWGGWVRGLENGY